MSIIQLRATVPLLVGAMALLLTAMNAVAHEEIFVANGTAPNLPEATPDNPYPHYFDLFTALACDYPTIAQDHLLDISKRFYHRVGNPLGVVPPPPVDDTREGRQRLLQDTRSQYAHLRETLPWVAITWNGEDAELVSSPSPLQLTSGLIRCVLVEVNNSSGEELTLSASPVLPARVFEPRSESSFVWPLTLAEVPDSGEIILQVGSAQEHIQVTVSAPAVISGTLLDRHNKPVAGRVYVSGSDGHYRFDPKFLSTTTLSEKPVLEWGNPARNYKLPFFYSDGSFEVAVPPGDVSLTVERGFEHERAELLLSDVLPGETRRISLPLKRAVDMPSRGWYSGDTHVHWLKNWWSENEEINLLGLVQRAEDLRVANNLTLLQANPKPGFLKPDHFPMGPIPGLCNGSYHAQMGEEFRNDGFYGHVCFLNITDLIKPVSTGMGSGGDETAFDYPTNRWAIEECHRQGGISTEAHDLGPFHRSDVPANVILGLSDALDQLAPENYYRFLDCGIRIPLGNGSDHPARLAGHPRMYVRIEGSFSYERWIEGIRKKRTFTTSGPLLFLSVNDADIGDVLDVGAEQMLTISAHAVSRDPIGNLQIISNGAVIATQTVDKMESTLTVELPAGEARWIVARCSPTDEYNVLLQKNAAHTSAIYVDVSGKRRIHREDVHFWIQKLQEHRSNVAINARFENDTQRAEALAHIDEGIAAYRSLLP